MYETRKGQALLILEINDAVREYAFLSSRLRSVLNAYKIEPLGMNRLY